MGVIHTFYHGSFDTLKHGSHSLEKKALAMTETRCSLRRHTMIIGSMGSHADDAKWQEYWCQALGNLALLTQAGDHDFIAT